MVSAFSALGVLDFVAAAMLFFPFSETVAVYVAMYMIVKGAFFLLTSVSSKSLNVPFIALCVIDFLTGLALGAISMGVASGPAMSAFVTAVKPVSLLKGIYSLVVSLM